MALIFEATVLDVGALVAFLLAVAYIYFKLSISYWKHMTIPYIKPTFHFGNFEDLIFLRKSTGHVFVDLYKKLDGEKYGGTYMFMKPGLIFRDPDIIKDVLVMDFTSVHDRGSSQMKSLNHSPATCSFFLDTDGEIFASNFHFRLKMMFQTLVDCGQVFGSILEETAINEEAIEIKDILARYSISACAFGIESNCLKNSDVEFRQ
jgi:cytochrome P450 family 6